MAIGLTDFPLSSFLSLSFLPCNAFYPFRGYPGSRFFYGPSYFDLTRRNILLLFLNRLVYKLDSFIDLVTDGEVGCGGLPNLGRGEVDRGQTREGVCK